jgi:hypothetical protein
MIWGIPFFPSVGIMKNPDWAPLSSSFLSTTSLAMLGLPISSSPSRTKTRLTGSPSVSLKASTPRSVAMRGALVLTAPRAMILSPTISAAKGGAIHSSRGSTGRTSYMLYRMSVLSESPSILP